MWSIRRARFCPMAQQHACKALKEALKIQVGFHAHNNLGLGVGNTLAAVEAGADQVDGTLRGLGAGAGNTATELLVATLDKLGYEHEWDVFGLLDAAEFVVAPFMPFQPFPDRDSIAIGYAGVYSTFLLHAKRLGQQYNVDPLGDPCGTGPPQNHGGPGRLDIGCHFGFSQTK